MTNLTHEIIKHILSKLGVDNELNKFYSSITDQAFLSDKKISFVDDAGSEIHQNLWTCKMMVDQKQFAMLFADCSINDDKQYALVISLEGSPAYGCYFSSNDYNDSAIYCFLNESWLISTIYVQATFLSGMEQIRELNLAWVYNDNIDDLYSKLIKLIELRCDN